MAAAGGEQPAAVCRHQRGMGENSLFRRAPDGDQPLATALAGEDEMPGARAHRMARQCHQFGRAQAGAIEQLDQRREAQQLRVLGCCGTLAGQRGEQGLNRALRKGARQGARGARALKIPARIIGAEALAVQKGQELPHRRGLAGGTGLGERRPMCGEACQPGGIRGGKTGVQGGAGLKQIGPIGAERVPGGAALTGQHVEEECDEGGIPAHG